MKILLVNHDDAASTRLKRDLTAAGHDVKTARDGTEARAMLRDNVFRLVISHVDLPFIDGVTLCRRIRKRRLPHAVHVILIAARKDELNEAEALSAGADDLLFEPVEMNELMRCIDNVENRPAVKSSNRALRKAQVLIRRKNRRLKQLFQMAQTLVDNVSHDFRTPLTVIKEYASLISEGAAGAVTPEQQQFLRVIEDRADDLNTMVDDMLDGSRLDSGMVSVARRSCRVADLIEHVRPILERKAEAKDVDLRFIVPERLSEVYVDDEKIGRVLTNLVVNAVKFCGEPGTVSVAAEQHPDGGVQLNVTDNGPGIDTVDQQKIFERFKQAGRNFRETSKGFGLGLSIAKELIDLNLGEMELVSAPGRGTTFSFTMPPSQPIDVLRRYLDRIDRPDIRGTTVSLIVATDRNGHEHNRGEIGNFLSHQLYRDDLLFQADDHRWLIFTPVPTLELHRMLERLRRVISDANCNRPNEFLPNLAFEHVGTWSINGDREEIGHQLVKQLLHETECLSFV